MRDDYHGEGSFAALNIAREDAGMITAQTNFLKSTPQKAGAKQWKNLGFAVAGLILTLTSVLAFRTMTYQSPDIKSDIALAPAPVLNIESAARHLGEAVRIQTVSHENAADNDPTQWDSLHAWLKKTYPAAHKTMSLRLVADRTLVYCWKGTDSSLAPIILMAHQDVVPITAGTESEWKHAPFSGEIADGAVWGRGSIDDKGSLIAIFEAIETLIPGGFTPKRTIYLVSGHDEEVSGQGARAAAAYLKRNHVLAEFILDEGMQVIADHPITKAPVALIGIAEKGFGTLEITAKTAGGHTSMPPKENAVINLGNAVEAIYSDPYPLVYDGPTADMLRALAPHTGLATKMAIANDWLFAPLLVSEIAATTAGAAMIHTTVAPTMLEGSPKENVLPAKAKAWINYRIAPGDTSATIMKKSQRAVAALPVTLRWNRTPDEPSSVSSTKSRAWQILSLLAKDISGAPVAPALFIGGSDSRYLQDVAKDTYRFQAITSSLDELDMIHGTNEHLTLDNLKQITTFYARLIATAAN